MQTSIKVSRTTFMQTEFSRLKDLKLNKDTVPRWKETETLHRNFQVPKESNSSADSVNDETVFPQAEFKGVGDPKPFAVRVGLLI